MKFDELMLSSLSCWMRTRIIQCIHVIFYVSSSSIPFPRISHEIHNFSIAQSLYYSFSRIASLSLQIIHKFPTSISQEWWCSVFSSLDHCYIVLFNLNFQKFKLITTKLLIIAQGPKSILFFQNVPPLTFY